MESHDQDPEAGLAAWRSETASRLAVLEADHTDAAYARRLHGAILRLAVLGELTAPVSQNTLLELLVGTAAQVLSAQAASLLLLDRTTDELVFEVALGAAAAEVRKFRVPVGQGIAGRVAGSGQPWPGPDLAQDPRFATDMAERIGYVPRTVLAIPLRLDEEVIGVIELFDKSNGQPFTAGDMELLDQFGRAAAAAIEQSQVMGDLTRLFQFVVGRLLGDSPDSEGRCGPTSPSSSSGRSAVTGTVIRCSSPTPRRDCRPRRPGSPLLPGDPDQPGGSPARAGPTQQSGRVAAVKPAWHEPFTPEALRYSSSLPELKEITPEWAWGGSTGRGVRVAVIDSGINPEHPAIGGMVRGYARVLDVQGKYDMTSRPIPTSSATEPPARADPQGRPGGRAI